MKWRREVPNKSEFVKVNSFNFIANEKKYNSEQKDERNSTGKIEAVKRTEENGYQQTTSQSKSAPVSEVISANNKEDATERRTNTETASETITLTKSRTDFNGIAPKRYVTKCVLERATVPYWYNEQIILKLNSTKRHFSETVFFKNKLRPIFWSENMSTEVKTTPKCFRSELPIPVLLDADDPMDCHYMSLEPQQIAAVRKLTEL